MRGAAFAEWVLLTAGCLFASECLASRTSLEGRGLPPLLAVDPSVIVFFPGTARDFQNQILADFAGDTSERPYQTPYFIPSIVVSTRFAMVLAGGSSRVAYVMDGVTHNVVVATPFGVGFTLGFSDAFDQVRQQSLATSSTGIQGFSDTLKISETRVRLGVSMEARLGKDRVVQISAGSTYLDTEFDFKHYQAVNNMLVLAQSIQWGDEPGWGYDVSLRTLSSHSGFLGGVQYTLDDHHPDDSDLGVEKWKRQSGTANLGWRVPLPPLDDFVVGVEGYWEKEERPQGVRTGYASTLDNELFFGGVFVSGEGTVLDRLMIRGGILGSGQFERETNQTYGSSSGMIETTTYLAETGRVNSPQFFMGAGWSWKSLSVDAQFRDSISLTNPFSAGLRL